MGLVWDALKEFFPSLKEATISGFSAFRTAKRKKRHIFFLKAIATNRDGSSPWPPPAGAQYELGFIQRQIMAAIVEEALHTRFETVERAFATFHLMKKDELNNCKKVAKKYGVPLMSDKEHIRDKIEAVLYEMVEDNKLQFHPPSRFSIL